MGPLAQPFASFIAQLRNAVSRAVEEQSTKSVRVEPMRRWCVLLLAWAVMCSSQVSPQVSNTPAIGKPNNPMSKAHRCHESSPG
jgi:hypothetical protein